MHLFRRRRLSSLGRRRPPERLEAKLQRRQGPPELVRSRGQKGVPRPNGRDGLFVQLLPLQLRELAARDVVGQRHDAPAVGVNEMERRFHRHVGATLAAAAGVLEERFARAPVERGHETPKPNLVVVHEEVRRAHSEQLLRGTAEERLCAVVRVDDTAVVRVDDQDCVVDDVEGSLELRELFGRGSLSVHAAPSSAPRTLLRSRRVVENPLFEIVERRRFDEVGLEARKLGLLPMFGEGIRAERE